MLLYAVILLFPPTGVVHLLVLGWFVVTEGISHRVHEVTIGAYGTVVFIGVVAQLSTPERRIAGMQQALVAIALLLTIIIPATGEFDPLLLTLLVPLVLIAALHPARDELFRTKIQPSRDLMVLAGIATIPLIAFAIDNIAKTATQAPKHLAHWPFMAAFGIMLVLISWLAALRPPGWRLTAWSAGGALAVYGLVSVVHPHDASSGGYLWGPLAMAWAIAFIVVAEREARSSSRSATETYA